jgi:YVTN family beta-propeller protein
MLPHRIHNQPSILKIAFFLLALTLVGCAMTNAIGKGKLSTHSTATAQFLKQIIDVPLTGGRSRFDYQSVDEQSGQLYIAHLGAGRLIAFDTKARKITADIADLPGVHGVLAIPELGRVYASATDANQVAVIDAKTLKIIARTPTGRYPDGLAYSLEHRKVFVSNQFGKSNTVIDTQTNQAIATINLGGEVGNTQYDPMSKRFLAAIQTRNQLVVLSPDTHQVLQRYDVPECEHPHGLLIDAEHQRVYVACEDNAKVMALDLSTLKKISSAQVGDTPDVLALDKKLQRLYVASEGGIVSIFSVKGDSLTKLEDIYAPSAHTIAVNQQTHEVYLPLENIGNQPVLRIMAASNLGSDHAP